eukprot:6464047-Lingulodinium_polyedra.AAC.1
MRQQALRRRADNGHAALLASLWPAASGGGRNPGVRNESSLPDCCGGRIPMRLLKEDDRFRIDRVLNDASFGERRGGRGVGQPSRVPR